MEAATHLFGPVQERARRLAASALDGGWERTSALLVEIWAMARVLRIRASPLPGPPTRPVTADARSSRCFGAAGGWRATSMLSWREQREPIDRRAPVFRPPRIGMTESDPRAQARDWC